MRISPALMERVDAGFAWLDENLPDWRQYVRLPLDMGDADLCVLGQFYKHKFQYFDVIQPFYRALGAYFDGDWDRARELGFAHDGEGYPELTLAWRQKFEEMNDNVEEAQG